jgi:gliding motility-associated-like protein
MLRILLFISFNFILSFAYSQINANGAYLFGNSVEIGINNNGHEGTFDLAGSNSRTTSFSAALWLGFVANPQMDGWVNYDGDFFTPGSPENGFGIEVNGVNYSNNGSGLLNEIPGTLSNYIQDGDCISVQWNGTVAGMGVQVIYRLVTTELFYTTEVTLTNNTGADLTNTYYYRNVDPDNNVTINGGVYATTNTIVEQPTGACQKALVSATQTAPWNSYLGFGAVGPEFRVCHGGFANRDASDIWNGVAPFTGAVGGVTTADEAISLGYRIPSLLNGASDTFTYVIVLDAAQVDDAFNSLLFFDYVGGLGGAVSQCASVSDTATTCAGLPVNITLNGPSIAQYSWAWTPTTDLSVATGSSVDASPPVTTTYTITGTPLSACVTNVVTMNIVVDVSGGSSAGADSTGIICNTATSNATLSTYLDGTAWGGGTWQEVTSSGQFNPATSVFSGSGLPTADYTFLYVTPISGLCPPDTAEFTITVSDASVVAANDTSICLGVSVGITASGVATYSWDQGLGAGQTHTVWPVVNTSYTVTGTDVNGCVNTDLMTVTILPGAIIDAGLDVTICAGDATILTATGGVTYTWQAPISAVGAAQNVSPATTTIYTVNGTDAGGCIGTDQVTVTINPLPTASIAGTISLCLGAPAPTITFTGANGTAPYTFTYNINGGAVQTIVSISTTASLTAPTGVAGTFNYNLVSVMDASSTLCAQTQGGTATVTVLPLDIATFTTTDFCFGSASPAATVTGLAGGTFALNPLPGDGATINATTGSIINGQSGATYTVEYTTNGPCPQSSTQTVTVNPLPIVVANDVSVCVGGNVNITASGATTYFWDNGLGAGQTHNVSPAVTTNYIVTGTDANGCVNTDLMTVTVLLSAPINAGPDVTICAGDPTTLTATGGVSYTWLAPISATGAIQVVSPAGTTIYTVNGVDAAGCSGTDQVTVTINPLPTATITGTTSVCIGDPSPTVTFTGAGGTSPYTFTYNINGGANVTITSVGTIATIAAPTGTAGTFNYNLVSVEDASATACSQAQVGIATIIVNPLPTATIAGSVNVCVGDPAATITFTGANGTAPYTFTYTLNGGANQTVTSVGTSATVSVPTGTAGTFSYDLVSVQDASSTNCSQVQVGNATVVVNPLPTATIAGSVNLCVGDPAATITFTGANGTAPYTFTYTINGGANQTVVSIGVIATVNAPTGTAGTFSYDLVSVQDASSTTCSQLQAGNATVVVNPLPTATIAGTTNVCVGDAAPTITFTGANGTAPYTFTYTLNGGANQTITSVGTTATITVATGAAGTFSYDLVSVQDASSTTCSQLQVGNATVVVNPLPTATIAGTVSICEGDPAATITFTGANGTAPYTFSYNINGGATQTITSVGATATISVPSTPVGTVNYNLVSVQDASSTTCSQAQVGTATVTINANPSPIINGATTYCAGDFSTLSTTLPYTTYLWSTGDVTPTTNVTAVDNPITVLVTNAFGCSATSAIFTVTENTVITYNTTVTICQGQSATIHGNVETVANVYSQTFILGTGCDSTSEVTLVVNPLPVINAGLDQILCFTDPITLNATGAPTIVWDVMGVTNGTPFTQAVGTVTYTATGTDINGCVSTDQVDVTINPLPTATIAGTATVCQNDATPTITFTGDNGTAPYTFSYSLNGGATQTITSVGTTATLSAPTGTVGTFNYTLISVQDASSTACSQAQVGIATIIVNPLPTAIIAGSVNVCVGDAAPSITFTGANGTSPYTFTYTLNGGANQTVTSVGTSATVSVPTGTAGTFSYDLVSVQDASSTNCSQVQVGNATVVVNPLPTATIAGSVNLCVGDPAATITFTGANGTAPYTFTYTINGGANQTVVSIGVIATVNAPTGTAGTFSYDLVSVQDASSTTCSQLQAGNATVVVNPLPTATIAGTTNVCVGDAAPTITFTGANGTAPYTFTYTLNGGANQTITSVGTTATITVATGAAGTFSYDLVSVQDASSTTCSQLQVGNATVVVNPLPTATIAGDITLCVNDVDPVVTFTGAAGTAPYTFTYTLNGGPNQTIISVGSTATIANSTAVAGTFVYELVSVQDASATGCSQAQTGTVTIVVSPLPTATISGTISVCEGGPDQTITFTGANGIAPYTFGYTLNGGAPQTVTSIGSTVTITVSAAVAGVFTYDLLGVQDSGLSGCYQAQGGTAIVTVNALPVVSAGNDFVVCEGSQAILTGSGALIYVWTGGVIDGQSFTPTTTGPYTVTGTDANGCVNTDDVIVTVEPLPVVSFIGDVLSGCASEPLVVTFTNTTPGTLVDCIWTLEDGTILTGCGTVTHTFSTPGTFDVTLTVTSANGCVNSVTYVDYIYVEGDPNASFIPSESVISNLNPTVLFENTSTGAVNYLWDFGDNSGTSTVVSPDHSFPEDASGSYAVMLVAYSPLGCTDTALATIQLNEEVIFYVPNTFTPDDDDYNPTFQPVFTSGFDPYDFTLLIFNRWGEIIFESHNAAIGWDGTYGGNLVQDGTYIWKIEFKTTANDERKVIHGNVNILK